MHGVAAAIDQDDRLPSLGADLGQRVDRAGMKRAADALPHVDDLDGRERPAVDPVGQVDARHRAPALGPRRRGAGHEHRSGLLGAPHGDLASVVARVALLLVGGVVLLVDHDQPEPLDGSEHRGARPDCDARRAGAQPPPLVVAGTCRHLRVQQRNRVSEAPLEPAHGLRSQGDLGDEHDRAPAALERRLHGLEVDLGLARAGDPVQQPRRRALAVQRARDRGDRLALGGVQLDAVVGGTDRGHGGPAPLLDVPCRDVPALLEAADRRAIRSRRRRQVARALGARCERTKHRALAKPQAHLSPIDGVLPLLGRLDLELGQRLHASRLRAAADPRRQRQAEAARGCGAVLLPDPAPELDEVGRHAGLERLERLRQLRLGNLAGLGEPDDDPLDPLAAERDHEDRPDFDPVHRLGQPVVERPPDAPGGQQRLYLRDGHRHSARLGAGTDARPEIRRNLRLLPRSRNARVQEERCGAGDGKSRDRPRPCPRR